MANFLSFSPDGTQLAFGIASWGPAEQNTANIWESQRGTVVHTLQCGGFPVLAVAHSPSGKFLATVGSDFTVPVFHAVSGDLRLCLRDHFGKKLGCLCAPDFSRTDDFWTRPEGRPAPKDECVCVGHQRQVSSLAYSGDEALPGSLAHIKD
ncbi:hypothetical protein T484DRAFT_1817056 [Baffinella frigidus]|nr:hypothetical protein T484DRAFT_1817056 [Cryptophyta sp. CCMP2293]